jgi:hypothetical protein
MRIAEPAIRNPQSEILATKRRSPEIVEQDVRFGDVVRIDGQYLSPCGGRPIAQLALYGCAYSACQPIPFQIDEQDAARHWMLDHGPGASTDERSEVLDDNGEMLFMAADAGDRAGRADLPATAPAAEIRVHDPLTGSDRWVYLLAFAGTAPRSPASYVRYDAAHDRVAGARVRLGFSGGIPDYLAVVGEASGGERNLLDRLKVRATATFLFGLIHFSRSEADLSTEFAGWRQGPIRVIRNQQQWIRLGWGIHSPTFGSYTYFYRDFAELPVALRLNFPPTYFFTDIAIRTVLDFRDLRGWSVLVPSLPQPIPIDGVMGRQKMALNNQQDSWFALMGPDITLLNALQVSPSLASTRRRLLYRETGQAQPPESVPGEEPGIGYQLDQWGHVGAGRHQLMSVSYALPPAIEPRAFMAARDVPLQVKVEALR